MRGAIIYAPEVVRVEDRSDPIIEVPIHAIIDPSASVAAGRQRQVELAALEASDPALDAAVDEACRAKYATSTYLEPMISARAKDATVRITPAAGSDLRA